MAARSFTVAEVERLIPKLESIFGRVLQLRGALRVQEETLARAGVRVTQEVLERDEPRDPFDVRHAKALFRAYYEALAEEVARIDALGGEVKDLETGLVDFPSRRGSERILLCWRLGERQIGFWHTLEGGFSGRRPLDEQVPRKPTPLD